MTSWTHLNYFKYIPMDIETIKLYNYRRVFVSIFFSFFLENSKGIIFAIMYSFLLLFGKLEKTKEVLFIVIWEKNI